MKLYYRGASYEYDPTKSASNSEFKPASDMIYRGIVYSVNPNPKPMDILATRVTQKLMYRGVTYFVNKAVHREVTVVTPPVSTPQFTTPSLFET
ncbi:DUF4278 domain-containing protein [Chlorogloeopsis sp. ULAP01]|uniref:DUF4278 domain-containing protein n=1 Tax=Chlorogloeopsis sp. ULAP01 TaxID=3056483 RepID=UPI0025AA59BF|nr:DUF4278 domain-containing protein [Chlorogloeopsis sp. ULAP01]MDM9380205.1 DUF4278 domain-containing protein [Chlorogloeopsis sp. ULAP01]